MEEALQARVEAEVSFDVAWGRLPPETGLPRATMTRVSGVQAYSSDGPGLMTTRVQIDCFGETYAQALQASRAIRRALAGWADGDVQGVFLDVLRDGIEGDSDLLDRVSMVFSVTYREDLPG